MDVDDIAAAYKKQRTFQKFITALKAVVEIGSVENFSGSLAFTHSRQRHIPDALKEFRMEDCKKLRTPAVIEGLDWKTAQRKHTKSRGRCRAFSTDD